MGRFVSSSPLILLMDTPEGRVGACPKCVRDQGVTLVSAWDFQEGCPFQPPCGLRPPPITPELTMRFYNLTSALLSEHKARHWEVSWG